MVETYLIVKVIGRIRHDVSQTKFREEIHLAGAIICRSAGHLRQSRWQLWEFLFGLHNGSFFPGHTCYEAENERRRLTSVQGALHAAKCVRFELDSRPLWSSDPEGGATHDRRHSKNRMKYMVPRKAEHIFTNETGMLKKNEFAEIHDARVFFFFSHEYFYFKKPWGLNQDSCINCFNLLLHHLFNLHIDTTGRMRHFTQNPTKTFN